MSVKARDQKSTERKKSEMQETSSPREQKTYKNRSDVFKAKDELLKAGTLFQDPTFPPTVSSEEVWVRPTDLTVKPTLTTNPMLLDLCSNSDGNGALMGAFATICLRKELVARICPDSQCFTNNYCGLFYFQFWQFGEWVIVVIDDRLPYNSSRKQLSRLRSRREEEFFFSLFEKAYAKFVGGYEAIARVKASDILVDLTGGVSEMWTLSKRVLSDWFPMLEKLAKAALPATANLIRVSETLSDFDARISYVLRDVVAINFPEENRTVRLVKLADPWGKLARYTGDWNNESPEWRKVPQNVREKLAPKNDGSAGAIYEFWMTYHDFMAIFTFVHFCTLSPKEMGPVGTGVKWDLTTIKDQFPRYIPAVSNIRSKVSTIYEIYPQYLVELTDVDDYQKDGKCELVVSLLQRSAESKFGLMLMGFSLFPLPRSKDRPPLKQRFFEETNEAARSPACSMREITCRLRLFPGNYVLIVLTTSEFKQREFIVRIFKHQRYNIFGHVIEYFNELSPNRKQMIPPSSRLAPVGPYDGPTTREDGKNPRISMAAKK